MKKDEEQAHIGKAFENSWFDFNTLQSYYQISATIKFILPPKRLKVNLTTIWIQNKGKCSAAQSTCLVCLIVRSLRIFCVREVPQSFQISRKINNHESFHKTHTVNPNVS